MVKTLDATTDNAPEMAWVPAHFPKDAWALARFDGTALYEHPDLRRDLGFSDQRGQHGWGMNSRIPEAVAAV
jgi:1,4-alpha-glucan branching enzyme